MFQGFCKVFVKNINKIIRFDKLTKSKLKLDRAQKNKYVRNKIVVPDKNQVKDRKLVKRTFVHKFGNIKD